MTGTGSKRRISSSKPPAARLIVIGIEGDCFPITAGAVAPGRASVDTASAAPAANQRM